MACLSNLVGFEPRLLSVHSPDSILTLFSKQGISGLHNEWPCSPWGPLADAAVDLCPAWEAQCSFLNLA